MHEEVVVYRGVQTADIAHMCTVLFSLVKSKNEKEASALPELTSRFRDFLSFIQFQITVHSFQLN